MTKPLDAVGEDGYCRIVNGCALHSPTCISDHDLVQRKAFFGSTDDDIAPDFGDVDHDLSLPEEPCFRGRIVQDSRAPRDLAVGLDAASEEDSRVTHSPIGTHCELLF